MAPISLVPPPSPPVLSLPFLIMCQCSHDSYTVIINIIPAMFYFLFFPPGLYPESVCVVYDLRRGKNYITVSSNVILYNITWELVG